LEPGSHTFEARAEGLPSARATIEAKPGAGEPVKLVLKKDAVVVVARRPLWPALMTGGAAIVAFAVGGGLAGVAAGKRADAESLRAKLTGANIGCATPPTTSAAMDCAAKLSASTAHDNLNKAALGTFVTGSVLAAAAAGLGAWAATGPKDE